MAGNNEIREMANAARSFEDRDFWDLYVRDRNGGFDHQRYQDEGYARDKYATFKGLVEDPASDVVFVRLVHETNPGKVPRYDDEGGAWKEEARELCKMGRRFMDRWTNEAEPRAVEIFVERPDGEIAKAEVPDIDDLWTAIDLAYPKAFEVLDDRALLPGDGAGYGWSESFRPEDDEAFARWYAEGVQTVLGALADDEGRQVTVLAKRREGVATVTWTSPDGSARRQDISLNDGDMERIVLGADPVAEGWEDGAGRLVCFENAEGCE